MALSKDQVLETEEFTSSIYTVKNCRNICSESFALDPIQVKYLESLTSCLAPLVQKKSGRPQKKRLQRPAKTKNKAKRHCTICENEKHNRRRCDQELDAESRSESAKKNHSNASFLFPDTESTWNSFSNDNKEQRSSSKQEKKNR